MSETRDCPFILNDVPLGSPQDGKMEDLNTDGFTEEMKMRRGRPRGKWGGRARGRALTGGT